MISYSAFYFWRALSALVCGASLLARADSAVTLKPAQEPPKEGAPVDVAPWGEQTSWAEGRDAGVYWEDQRDILRVRVVFKETPPDPKSARLQWWHSRWPEGRIPRDRHSGAGEAGWLNIGDWYQGDWRDGDTRLNAADKTWEYTFHPVNRREFSKLKDFAAEYRTTMKVRLMFDGKAPAMEKLQVFTDSVWHAGEVAAEWGGTAETPQTWDGRLEVFNGYVDRIAPLSDSGNITISAAGTWKSEVKGRTDGIRARIWSTRSPNLNSFDKTIVTVRAEQHSFSFLAGEVDKGARVFAPLYGAMVRRADEPETYADALRRWQSRAEKSLYERVFDEPEQTFARAWADMPPKRQFYIPLGCEGGRQRFGAEPDGSVFCRNDRIDEPRGKDTPRRKWGGNSLRYTFGLPSGTPEKRWIDENSLPIVNAQWIRDGVRYTQTAFATRLEAGGLGWPDMRADDTTVLLARVTCENTGSQPAKATLTLGVKTDAKAILLAREGMVFAKIGNEEHFRYRLEGAGPNVSERDGGLVYETALPAGGTTVLFFKIPFITLEENAEFDRLKQMSFDRELERVRDFWRRRADGSCRIDTPVPEISNFYRADVSHLLINCGREVNADRLMARVGSFSYGVYGNESCMMITDLDRRGMHDEAARCLETFLHYQGTSPLPGDYLSQDAVFNGAGGWESGGYNQHHGWILWAMAEHYWYTGDRAWLERNAQKLIKACDWIVTERKRSLAFSATGMRGIERGLLPQGSLEDIADWRCWLSNNLFSWWGLDAVAKALEDISHPRAKALRNEAEAYRADLLAAFMEAMVRSPLVSLRDGSYIPAIPSEVHRRGRAFGWITTTLEGPIYLIRTGAMEPGDPLAKCVMQDYEDNLYLSEQFGYSPSNIPSHWFSRGGFSMQPNLLCSPHPYLMRDDIKHYLRAYFNAFASAYYSNTQMLTEHPLPDLADWRGDHYKSSDESNSTYWLRLMFIDERDEDLYLGMAVPRAWLRDGDKPAIERAATRFGVASLRFESRADRGWISAEIDPPTRRTPKQAYLRFRHPAGKPIARVTIDGKPWDKFDARRELVELPKLGVKTVVKAEY